MSVFLVVALIVLVSVLLGTAIGSEARRLPHPTVPALLALLLAYHIIDLVLPAGHGWMALLFPAALAAGVHLVRR